jgi:hypothetical protein
MRAMMVVIQKFIAGCIARVEPRDIGHPSVQAVAVAVDYLITLHQLCEMEIEHYGDY